MNHIYLYEEVETDFNHNGITLIDFEDEPVIKRVINNEFTFNGIYSLIGQNAKYIKNGGIIKAYCPDRSWQLFRILLAEKTLTTIEIFAFHICYDAKRNFIESFFESNGSGAKIMSGLEQSLAFEQRFNYSSDIITNHQFTAKEGNPIDILIGSNNGGQNLTGVTGGELDMDNFNLSLKKQLGSDRGFRVDFGINLDSIKETTDHQSIVNSLYLIGAVPEGSDYEGEQDPIVYKYLEVEGTTNKNRIIGTRTNSECKNLDELKKWGQDLFDKSKIHLPRITHEISIIDLAKTEEYKEFSNLVELQIGDTIHVSIDGFDDIEERMIEYNFFPRLAQYKDMVLGNDLEMYSNTVNSQVNDVLKNLEETSNILTDKIINATNQITGTVGGYVRFRPKNKPSEILIMDTDNVNTAKNVWRWNLGGLGHSSNGINGPFPLAMTADGQIVATAITAGRFNAEMLRVGFNGIGDTLELVNNALSIKNNGIRIMELTKQGLQFWKENTSLGRMGTSGNVFDWSAGGNLFTDKSIFITLDTAGETIQISPKANYGIQFLKNGEINSKGDWIHAENFGVQGDVRIVGNLIVNGKPVIPGTGGEVPPGLTTEQEKNAWSIWTFFKQRGWTEQSIAGMLGNMETESGIRPDIDEIGGGTGYGLVQWTPKSKLVNWANANGLDYRTLDTQCKRIQWEVENNQQWIAISPYYYSFREFTQKTSISECALAFIKCYERPGDPNQPIRVTQAQRWYDKLRSKSRSKRSARIGYGLPLVDGFYISQHYSLDHEAIDLTDELGVPVFSVQDGYVLKSDFKDDLGEYVVIAHEDGNQTTYAHLNKRFVNKGDKVARGQQIGELGNTGNSDGAHLHFSLKNKDGFNQDPSGYLNLNE
ncbi:phage tail tip lysozyme [Carnobacterium divergens]|uniref:phage tail tip lysozyme n=1 Tax=Carnobacterium divergens TaxID=2748 RepID=UPI0039BE38A0